MSELVLSNLPSTTAHLLGSAFITLPWSSTKIPLRQPVPLARDWWHPEQSDDAALSIVVPDFGIDSRLPLTNIVSEIPSGRVVLEAALGPDSRIVVKLLGDTLGGEDKFYVRNVDLNTKTDTKIARSDFVITTLRATFGLAGEVNLRLPDLVLDLSLKFNESLKEISQLLRRRQIAYRIMVIETAINHQFDLPVDISGVEVEHIALAYHAIIERSFEWPIETSTIVLPATRDGAQILKQLKAADHIPLGPYPQSRTIFGFEVPLGSPSVMIENATIEDAERALYELERGDGHPVPIQIRSQTGRGKWIFHDAPSLPSEPWDPNMQFLIDLEEHLDARLVGRYNALAASTLDGLTDSQKTEVTVRSGIGEAFLITASPETLENF